MDAELLLMVGSASLSVILILMGETIGALGVIGTLCAAGGIVALLCSILPIGIALVTLGGLMIIAGAIAARKNGH